ncbi:DUF4212 domain-containing protein [Noviherbaspirillum saxi]|uniref:DUF4212 domain-containing protein n=1 Tax=Noviherbaspirillum saxi TaxID=2320863 RepID=A0A3A3FNW5_9BURK|nr:DUF4212 domain-containing protein [Noviherbaspirillum saxi]RJF97872.1 DUF4212 domain-containing protein [Noviherbaspirillum saxi]
MDAQTVLYRRALYWRRVRRFTGVLIAIWFSMTFGLTFFARELSGFTILGWPFSFYMAGQGLTVLYLVIVAVYMQHMSRLDRLLDDEPADAE